MQLQNTVVDTPVRLPFLQPASVNLLSRAEGKIGLFRSLFRGGEGVYPRGFESRKTGRSGYSPACAHEWVTGICEKPGAGLACSRTFWVYACFQPGELSHNSPARHEEATPKCPHPSGPI
jgi:hypothetical protein